MQNALQCNYVENWDNMPAHDGAEKAKEYRIITRVKNNLLMSAIEKAGYTSVAEFAVKANVTLPLLRDIINFKVSPLDKNGDWRPIIHSVCVVLNKMPSQLFTEAQTRISNAKSKEIEVSEAEAFWALEHSGDHNPQQLLETKELNSALYSALDTLEPRLKDLMNMYYGIDGPAMAFNEIAAKWNLSIARVIQLHNRALMLLRKPSAVNNLKLVRRN
jgi:hypothetical protein